ncbi:MAG TPA: cytochrome P450 [Thermoanaerobaculia bacterium]|nr:cytochrome P450 [Thermoanaerobaculia bacterium]
MAPALLDDTSSAKPRERPASAAAGRARPPGPRGLPLLGCLPAFRRDPLAFLQRTAREHGDVAFFRLGTQNVFLLNDPELIREVLVQRQGLFTKSRGLRRARALLGDGLLTSEGEVHHRHRRLVQPAFHPDRLQGYAEVMVDAALETGRRWRAGESVEVFSEMARITLGVVGTTLFSVEVEEEAQEIGTALTSVLEMFSIMMLPFSGLVERLPLPVVRRFHAARSLLDGRMERLIHERRESGRDSGDLLSMLLLAQDEAGGGLSDREVREEALTLFLAGHETTANALSWTLYLLASNPDCEARLHRELEEVLGGRRPTFADLPRLSWAEHVLAEAIRLYPPAWAIGRSAREALELGGFEVPAGSTVILSAYVTQNDPRYFPHPEVFDPERWQPGPRAERPKFVYFPFGGGARTCIGERFAMMEGVLILATLAQRWRLRLAPGQTVEPMPLINTLRARGGLPLRLEARGAPAP